ncbi:MAG: DUF2461 domain-containing protein [Oscillospiraceae bacterium]|nr:DUF2461 domain-containing protein [Oscillospiraceae bacterium]
MFSEKTGEFLTGLMFNNERGWFEAHREEYEKYLLRPFRECARRTAELMQERFPEKQLNLHIARIYRDARRLHGRGPYKDHLWFSLKSWDGLLQGPMFWFEIGAVEYSYGMGYYSASAEQMTAYRRAIDADIPAAERMARRLLRQNVFRLDVEEYKRPKGERGKLLDPWYNTKRVGFICTRDFGGELFSESLPETLAEGYAFLMPYYDFLCRFM